MAGRSIEDLPLCEDLLAPGCGREKALVADELAHQVELDAIVASSNSAQRSDHISFVPIYVELQRLLMDEHEMLGGVSDSDSSDDDALELS